MADELTNPSAQQELFEHPAPPPYVPYVAGSDTSEAAARAFPHEGAKALRRIIDNAIIKSGDYGHTDDELQVMFDLEGSTQRPRRIELVQQRRVEASNLRRRTRTGRLAVVWVTVKPT